MKAKMEQTYEIKKSVAFRLIKDEVVIVDTNTNKMMMFNGTASDIWMALSQGKTMWEIATGLITEYDVDASKAQNDVLEFVQTLVGKALVEKTSP